MSQTGARDIFPGRSPFHEIRPAGPNTNGLSFPALLTGYTLIGPNRYAYSWVEAEIGGAPTYVYSEKTDGRTSSADGGSDFAFPALGNIEAGNNGVNVESGGVNVDGSAYPDEWYLQPLRGSSSPPYAPGSSGTWPTSRAPGVDLTPRVTTTGAQIYTFTAVNVHDGTCDDVSGSLPPLLQRMLSDVWRQRSFLRTLGERTDGYG